MYTVTGYEFDSAKSRANKEKHGIDFIEAQWLWQDSYRIEIHARTEDEPREIILGRIGTKVWAAITTERDGRVRIISARRAREEEVEIYEG